jgi:hypothetical protein
MCKNCERTKDEKVVYSVTRLGESLPEEGQYPVGLYLIWTRGDIEEPSEACLRVSHGDIVVEIPINYCPFCGEKL